METLSKNNKTKQNKTKQNKTKQNKAISVAFSAQANCVGRMSAAYRRSECKILQVDGVARSPQRIPMTVILSFLDRSCHFFIKVATQIS
jgi:hypothetical protein